MEKKCLCNSWPEKSPAFPGTASEVAENQPVCFLARHINFVHPSPKALLGGELSLAVNIKQGLRKGPREPPTGLHKEYIVSRVHATVRSA